LLRYVSRTLRWTGLGLCCVVMTILFVPSHPAVAAGGPENVALLVNAASDESKTIANHYIRLRNIPPRNVIYLDCSGSRDSIGLDKFCEAILEPALDAIQKRRLLGQIDYLIYSSDFPWRIDLKADLPREKFPKHLTPVGSLTGVTYLWQLARSKSEHLVSLGNNFYAPVPLKVLQTGPTRSQGFRSWYGWSAGGKLREAGGTHYLLSTMLGVTGSRGNTVDQIVDYLQRSTVADGTHPRGTIYYMENNDVRSKTRQSGFEQAVAQLRKLGVDAEVVEGVMPIDRPDVQVLMAGTRHFNWQDSHSTILPGAICEHLTSFGGVLGRGGGGQTPLTEFLRYGAAGASGTVVEPYSLQAKFPLPAIHVHYARGCTLAEAFYQSVSGPYQLLIVGDPLCRPWAVIPTVHVAGITPGQTVKGTLSIQPRATIANPYEVDRFELFVDGLRVADCRPGETLNIPTNALSDGYHELRIVAIEAGPIHSQGRLILPIMANNHGDVCRMRVPGDSRVPSTGSIELQVMSPGATSIDVILNHRRVGRLEGSRGRVNVPAGYFGRGPITLQAVARGERTVSARPVSLDID